MYEFALTGTVLIVAVYLLVAAGRAVARRVRLRPVAADEAAAADARVGVA